MKLSLLALSRVHWVFENVFYFPVVIAVAGFLYYWATIVDRRPPIALSDGTITPLEVEPGAYITPRWAMDRIREQPCSFVLSREIVDSTNVVWRKADQQISDYVYPDDKFIARPMQVPFGAAWGPARYHLVMCFRCQGLSATRAFPACIRWPELPFEIAKPTTK